MASEGSREPAGERIKLSADVKPFVPRFAGLHVAWLESSEGGMPPGCAAACCPELPLPEREACPEGPAVGAAAIPPQPLAKRAQHPYACPSTVGSAQNVCPVPASQRADGQPGSHRRGQKAKPRCEHRSPLPRDTKALLQKTTYDDQKCDSEKADGNVSSDVKSIKGSHRVPIRADTNLKSGGSHDRTDRKSRVMEKSGPASKPEFAFSRLDFPELPGVEKNERSETLKAPQWGPPRSAPADPPLGRAAEGEIVVKNNNTTDSVTDNATTNPSSCTRELSWTPMGYVFRQTLRVEPPPAPRNVASVISLRTAASSADPKRGSLSTARVLSSDPSSSRGKPVVRPAEQSKASQGGEPERNEALRKSKKTEVKPKAKHDALALEEPPRIENNRKSSRKKSQVPVQLDLGGMLTALEKKQHSQHAKQSSRPVVFSVGAVPVLSKDTTSGRKGHRFGPVKTPHNPLDSSAPLTKKGKQREVPKAKKPTSLKKIILKERQERKQQRLQENASDKVHDTEHGGDSLALQEREPLGLQGAEVPSCPAPGVMITWEEPPEPETHEEVEACSAAAVVPDPPDTPRPRIHSRRFRDYCSQLLSREVDACVAELLRELVRFQDRMYQKDPVKAKTKRRLVLGLREVLKHLRLRKLKCVIISPNCEKIQSKGGLDDTLHTIIDYACEQDIPFVFALNRKALGRSLNKAVPVSVVGIFSYDGAQDQFHRMVELTMAARQAYKAMLQDAQPAPQAPPGQPAPGPSPAAEDSALAPAGTEEPPYLEVWRKHLEAYSQRALELEASLEASTSQMRNLNL